MEFCSSSQQLGLRLEGTYLPILVIWSNLCSDNFQTCFDCDTQLIPGQDGRAAEALCWVGQRLFSAGLNGEITEYDLENLRPKYTVEAYGGPIWAISSNSQGTLLAVSQDVSLARVGVISHIQASASMVDCTHLLCVSGRLWGWNSEDVWNTGGEDSVPKKPRQAER